MPTDDFIPLLFRPLRQLLDEGKPVGPITVLWAGDEENAMPLGCAARTSRNRLIFWPIMPPKVKMVGEVLPKPIDHITLEFPSRKMHATYYDDMGGAGRRSQGWRLHDFGDSGLALWFQFLVRWPVSEGQDRVGERCVPFPNSDAERRKAEFVRFVQNLKGCYIRVPPRDAGGDFLFCTFYIATARRQKYELTKDMLVCVDVDSQVEGWPNGPFAAFGTRCDVGDVSIIVACVCPPGRLRHPVSFGFPGAVSRRSAG